MDSMHMLKVSLGNKTARFAVYKGIPVAELADVFEAVLPCSAEDAAVGLEAGDGTVYGISTICNFPELLREESFALVVHQSTRARRETGAAFALPLTRFVVCRA